MLKYRIVSELIGLTPKERNLIRAARKAGTVAGGVVGGVAGLAGPNVLLGPAGTFIPGTTELGAGIGTAYGGSLGKIVGGHLVRKKTGKWINPIKVAKDIKKVGIQGPIKGAKLGYHSAKKFLGRVIHPIQTVKTGYGKASELLKRVSSPNPVET